MENNYSYYISFEYQKEVFSFELFGTNTKPVFGSATLNFNKPSEEFTNQDYETIRQMIADSLNQQEKEKYREATGEEKKVQTFSKEHIIIISIIPKKYEVLENEGNN